MYSKLHEIIYVSRCLNLYDAILNEKFVLLSSKCMSCKWASLRTFEILGVREYGWATRVNVTCIIVLFLGHRNVLKATIEVPEAGELNFYCTHLDHLDENWRMKQINAIIQSNDEPYILAGGLNSLDESDYSQERWTDIVKVFIHQNLNSFLFIFNLVFKITKNRN